MALIAAIGLLVLWVAWPGMAAGQPPTPPAQPPPQTLCILDFNRLGDDASADWLQRGLADMMIGTMNRTGPYRVVERQYLREILREHGLAAGGLVDLDTAVRQARLARAELLLLGSFARQQDRLTIQVRLLRVTDQEILAQAVWTDQPGNVLAAPRALSEALLARLGQPVDPAWLDGIEKTIPRRIDVAKSYYTGVGAFDDGRYPEALAHYLDAARHAGGFVKVYPAVLEMYTLLGQREHAVLFAQELARVYERAGDVPSALEYYYAAARQSLDPPHNTRLAIRPLEQLLRLVRQHEERTGEIATAKQAILAKIRDGTGTVESFRTILTDGQAVTRPAPVPPVLMWKIRAQRTLARAHARVGAIERALDQYRELLAEVDFLTRDPLADGKLGDPIRTEAHFMVLHHYAKTGRLIRDHALNAVNRLNVVRNGLVFTRDFGERRPDPRARTTSRYADRGYEYFDFAAPAGQQIEAVTLRTTVEGIAAFGFYLPHAAGWPPRYSLSRRLTDFKFSRRGRYERTVALPPGTEFFSIGTSWGPGLLENTPVEVLHHQRFGPKNGRDLVSWQVSFVLSPKRGAAAKTASNGATPRSAPVPRLIERYAAGWENACVVRQPETRAYAGEPLLDVYDEDWLVVAMDGDIQILHRRDPQLRIELPITINTADREFDPSLVRTHAGLYALLWARGTSTRNARRFVAFSADLLRWDTPQRMVFEGAAGNIGYTYAGAEPLERTTNVVAIPRGYVMLLAQGFVRTSDDLRHWGPPRKAIPQDLYRNRLVKTADGTLWAVYERSSGERQPYTPDDWLHGYFVVDGKPYRHVTEVRVSRSVDGVQWHAAGTRVFPGQPSGLWAFPVSERQIGIAVAFNNLFAKWMTASRSRDLHPVDSALEVMRDAAEAECFAQDGSLTCIRPVFDVEQQQPMLLATSSRALYRRLTE
jgi:TolB-like protein